MVKNIIKKRFLWVVVFLFSTIGLWVSPRSLYAHEPVIVDQGSVDGYDWSFAYSPYPTAPGEVVLTFWLVESQSRLPVSGVTGEAYLARPGSTTPCCQSGVDVGPSPVKAYDEMFPGEYVSISSVDAPGLWQVYFQLQAAGKPLNFQAKFQVEESWVAIEQTAEVIRNNAVATYEAYQKAAVNQTPIAGQPVSPLIVVDSPLQAPSPTDIPTPIVANVQAPPPAQANTTPPPNNSMIGWWLWGGGTIILLIAAIAWRVRTTSSE